MEADMWVLSIICALFVTLAVSDEGGAITLDIPPPTVKAFNDNKDWMLVEDVVYKIGNTTDQIVVPAGFVTDFATIPKVLGRIFALSPHDRYSRAAIVHDFLYWAKPCSRLQSDNILMIAMTESGVETSVANDVYNGVTSPGGEVAWNRNKKEREQGLPRIIPPELRTIPTGVSWKEYREILVKKHKVNDVTLKVNSDFCKHGKTTIVPK
jgi:hypothetical protein